MTANTERALSTIYAIWSFVLVLYFVKWITDKPLSWDLVISVAAGVTLTNLFFLGVARAARK